MSHILLKAWLNVRRHSLNMRNYIKRTATKAVDTINIMNPIPVQRRLACTTPVREAAHWPGLDLYDEERRKLEDGCVEVAVVSLFVRWRLFCVDKLLLLAYGDQGRQGSPLRLITTWRLPPPVQGGEVIRCPFSVSLLVFETIYPCAALLARVFCGNTTTSHPIF